MKKRLTAFFCAGLMPLCAFYSEDIARATPMYYVFETTTVVSIQDFYLDKPIGLKYIMLVDFEADGINHVYPDNIVIDNDRQYETATYSYNADYFYTDLIYGKYVTGENVESNFQTNDVIGYNYGVFLSKDNVDPIVPDYFQVSFQGGSSYEYLAIYQINSIGQNAFDLGVGSVWSIQDGYRDTNGLFHYIMFDAKLCEISDKYMAPVPEPTTILLSGLGLLGMGAYIRRRRKK